VIIDYRKIEGNEYGFPPWLMAKLDCPSAGEGVHNWLWHAACALRHYVEIDKGIEIARVFMTRDENPPGEIARTFENAYSQEYHGLPAEASAYCAEEFPKNPAEVERIFRSYKKNPLKLLRDASNPIPDIVGVLDALYSDDDLICVGNAIYARGVKHGYTANTLQKKILVQADDLSNFSQIVPNPMLREWGYTRNGKESERSVDNAAILRTYAVTDFDFTLQGVFGGGHPKDHG
jgi:hypothetical protein